MKHYISRGRTKRYPNPNVFSWVSLDQIAKEIDRTPIQTIKLLTKSGFIGYKPKRGSNTVIAYDARSLDVLKGMLNIPHRHVSDTNDDWLTTWLDKGEPNG